MNRDFYDFLIKEAEFARHRRQNEPVKKYREKYFVEEIIVRTIAEAYRENRHTWEKREGDAK